MFRFKQFTVEQDLCAMKVGTDGVLLGAWSALPIGHALVANDSEKRCSQVLDVGTGTGLIALMMAQRFPEVHVTAIDIDEGAVCQATLNVAASPFANRIAVRNESVQQLSLATEWRGMFDAVVSNPPFFIGSLHAPDVQRSVARHADTLTYADLMQSAWRLLSDVGELSVVVPFDYRQRMEDEATFVGFFPSRVCAVRTVAKKPARRYLLSFRKHPCEHTFEVMTMGDDTYRAMTQDFYL